MSQLAELEKASHLSINVNQHRSNIHVINCIWLCQSVTLFTKLLHPIEDYLVPIFYQMTGHNLAQLIIRLHTHHQYFGFFLQPSYIIYILLRIFPKLVHYRSCLKLSSELYACVLACVSGCACVCVRACMCKCVSQLVQNVECMR